MKKVIAVVAVFGMLAAAGQALATDKLIVQDSTGTNTVFKVDDTGMVTATKFGLGTTNPQASFESSETTTSAARGVMVSQHNDGAQAASIVFVKSRGTLAAPTSPIANDYIGLFQAQYWNGTAYDRGAQFGFRNDAAVSAGSFPTAIMFYTGSSSANLKEGLRISSTGSVVAGNLGGAAAGALATTATDGFMYIPTVAGALTSCSTATQVTGHVPVWFDTTNSKICTCSGTTLKCTAALN